MVACSVPCIHLVSIDLEKLSLTFHENINSNFYQINCNQMDVQFVAHVTIPEPTDLRMLYQFISISKYSASKIADQLIKTDNCIHVLLLVT